MELISFGCSLIFGTDLSDDGCNEAFPRYSNLTWPALLAKNFNLSYWCHAHGGRGNLSIVDRLLHQIQRYPKSLFIIQWTYIDRFDFSDPNGHHFNNGANDWNCILPSGRTDLSKDYYQNLHSEYRDKLVNLSYIMTAIHELERYNCRYIMTYVDDLLWCDTCHASPGMIQLQQFIRPSILDFEGRNFVDWSRHRGFDISATGHPLEQAHAAAAELMAPSIDAILHKA